MTSHTILSIDCLCRICAEKSDDLIPIFTDPGLDLNIHNKIETHLGIKVNMSDGLPHQVCQSCILKLNICHDLLQTAKAADLKLRHLIKDSYKNTDVLYVSKDVTVLNDADDINKCCTVGDDHYQLLSTSVADQVETCERASKSASLDIHYELSAPDNEEETSDLCKTQQIQHVINESVIVSNDNTYTLQQVSSQNENDRVNLISVDESHTLTNSYKLVTEGVCSYDISKEECVVSKDVSSEGEIHKELSNTLFENENSNESNGESSKCKRRPELETFTCPHCNKVCQTAKGLDVHISTHSGVSPYLCDLCGKKFKHVNNLRCHKRTHREESLKKKHLCSLCNKGFRSKFHLSEHLNMHNDIRPYACSTCTKTFHKRILLRQHVSTHISEKDKVVCDTCGSRFTRRSNLTQHIRKCHAENRTFKCRVCLEEFPSLSLLLSHRSTHTQESMKQHPLAQTSYSCQICGKIFLKKRSYKLHAQSHSGEKKCWCDICGKVLSSKASLNYHKKSFHCSERTWHCQFCGKGFMSNHLQLIHERTHTGVKPYTCSVCSKAFSGLNNLNQHMKKHLDLRNFECTYCSKRFQRKATLTVHLRTHTGEKPYICDICGHRFNQKSDMLKHQRIHDTSKEKAPKNRLKKDSGKEFVCDLCNSVFNCEDELEKHKVTHNVSVPVVFTVQNSDVLSSFTEIIAEECQTVITLSNVQPYNILKPNR